MDVEMLKEILLADFSQDKPEWMELTQYDDGPDIGLLIRHKEDPTMWCRMVISKRMAEANLSGKLNC